MLNTYFTICFALYQITQPMLGDFLAFVFSLMAVPLVVLTPVIVAIDLLCVEH